MYAAGLPGPPDADLVWHWEPSLKKKVPEITLSVNENHSTLLTGGDGFTAAEQGEHVVEVVAGVAPPSETMLVDKHG